MYILFTVFMIFIYQYLWFVLIKDFKLNKYENIICCFITITYLLYYNYQISPIDYLHIPYFLIVLIMTNLSFTDYKYYEISGKSYWFIILPLLFLVLSNIPILLQFVISFFIVFLLFLIVDKVIGIEKIGGADIKLLLLLSITIPYHDAFLFLMFSFLFDCIIFVIKYIYYKLISKNERVQIPMIIAINIAWIITGLLPQ